MSYSFRFETILLGMLATLAAPGCVSDDTTGRTSDNGGRNGGGAGGIGGSSIVQSGGNAGTANTTGGGTTATGTGGIPSNAGTTSKGGSGGDTGAAGGAPSTAGAAGHTGIPGSGGNAAGAGGAGGTAGAAETPQRRCGVATTATEPYLTLVPSGETSSAYSIAADSASVYWNEYFQGQHRVRKVPKTGGTPTTLYTAPTDQTYSIYGLVADDTSVHFYLTVCCSPMDSMLMRASTNEGAVGAGNLGTAKVLTHLTNTVNAHKQIAADGANVYAIDNNRVVRVSKTSGTVTPLFETSGAGPTDPTLGMAIGFPNIDYLTVDGAWAYYIVGQSYGGAIAAASPLANAAWLLKAPLQGGDPVLLTTKGQVPYSQIGVAVSNGFAYWVNYPNNKLYKKSVDNPASDPIVLATMPGLLNNGTAPATDGKNLYFVVDGDLCRMPVDGGDAVGLLYGRWAFGNVAYPSVLVDDTNVYVTFSYNQGILAVPK